MLIYRRRNTSGDPEKAKTTPILGTMALCSHEISGHLFSADVGRVGTSRGMSDLQC